MNNLVSLILAVSFLAGCGRKSDPTPETKDSYPRIYPAPLESSVDDRDSGLNSPSSYEIKPKSLVIDPPKTYFSPDTDNKDSGSVYILPEVSSRTYSVSEPNTAQKIVTSHPEDRNVSLYAKPTVPGAPRVGTIGELITAKPKQYVK